MGNRSDWALGRPGSDWAGRGGGGQPWAWEGVLCAGTCAACPRDRSVVRGGGACALANMWHVVSGASSVFRTVSSLGPGSICSSHPLASQAPGAHPRCPGAPSPSWDAGFLSGAPSPFRASWPAQGCYLCCLVCSERGGGCGKLGTAGQRGSRAPTSRPSCLFPGDRLVCCLGRVPWPLPPAAGLPPGVSRVAASTAQRGLNCF